MFTTEPRPLSWTIEFQPHKLEYMSAADWFERNRYATVSELDKQMCIDIDQIYVVQWYPETPVGFYAFAAPTMDRCLTLYREHSEN